MRQCCGIVIGRGPPFPHCLVEGRDAHPEARGGFITLAVVFEFRQLSEASYFVHLSPPGFLDIGAVASVFKRVHAGLAGSSQASSTSRPLMTRYTARGTAPAS